MKRCVDKGSSIVRVSLIVGVILIGLIASIVSMASMTALALPKVIEGHVLDGALNPLVGASVRVNMKSDVNTVRSYVDDTTDENGLFRATFDGMVRTWQVGDIIEIVVTKDAQQYTDNDQYADDSGIQHIEVTWPYAIPEFGTVAGFFVGVTAVAIVAIVLVGKKKRTYRS